MSNTNTNLQTQTSNALHNAIMEAGGKDRPPILAPDNYVQWKSRIKRYIDIKPNNELIHYCLQNPPNKFKWTEKTIPVSKGSTETNTEGYMENYKNVSQDMHDQLNAKAEAVQLILTWIDNDIYSTADACLNACEMWKEIKRFYKMMNELVRNQCDVINHQVNVQFLLQLQPEWQRFMTLVKQSQELKTVSYHKLYDILKQHQTKVNEIRAERLAPNIRNRGKTIVNSSTPTYDQEPKMVDEDDELSKEKEIDKLMALISLSFKKIYKPTNNNLRTSSNTSRANQDNTLRINRGTGYNNQRVVNVVGARENVGTQVVQKCGIQCYNCKEYEHVSRECQKPKRVEDAAYHKEKMDDTVDEPEDQELEAHYMYMAHIQEVTPNVADNSGPIFDVEPLQKDDQDDNDYLAKEREIEDFKTKNKSLESSNNHFKEANNELSKTNQLMFKDLKKFQAKLDRFHDVNYASKVAIDCAKAKWDLMSCKMESEKEYYYAVHMNVILGVYTTLDEFTDLQCDYLDQINKCELLEKELSKSKTMSKSFEVLQKHAINLELALQQCKEQIKNDKAFKENQSNLFLKEREQYFEIQDLKAQLQDKGIAIRVIPTTSVSRPQLKSNQLEDRVMPNNSQGKKQEVEDHRLKCLWLCLLVVENPHELLTNLLQHPLREQLLSPNQKRRSTIRKQYEQISKTCKWWYCKFTPSGYKWKPNFQIGIVNTNVSMPLGNASRTTNILEPMTLRCSIVSNTPLSSNSFAARRDKSIHRRLWVLKAHDGKSQASNSGKYHYQKGLLHRRAESHFRKSTGYIRDLKGNDLLTGSRGTNLYSITLQDTYTPNHICLMAKATSSQAWLWHHLFKRTSCSRGTEFLNKTLHGYFAQEGIEHQTSIARTPKQNSIVERQNRTLVEAARTMLSAAKVPLFFLAKAIATLLPFG
ncbi:retrovirus-related pol polyprotein from transposon TNT 1-94 [Tanacetum coccineum]